MEDLNLSERKALAAALQQHNDEDSFVSKILVLVDPKKKKAEERILLIGKHRMYIFKPGGKIDVQAHLLEILEVNSSAETALYIKTKAFVVQLAEPAAPILVENILINLLASFLASFQGKGTFPMNILPADRSEKIKGQANEMNTQVESYCGGFVTFYQSVCDQMKIPICQDIAWDIEHLYVLNDVQVFDMFELSMRTDKLANNDWKALLQALEYNDWFTTLKLQYLKLEKEAYGYVVNCIAKNSAVQKMIIKDVGAPRDFFEKLAVAFEANPNLAVNALEFSGNDMEDKGAIALAGSLAACKKGLVQLEVARCGIEKKGMIAIAKALENESVVSNLAILNISGNKLDPESCKALSNAITKMGSLKELNIGFTGADFHLLSSKKSESVISLDISGHKIVTKDSKHLDFLKFLSYFPNLQKLNLSGCQIPPEIFADIVRNTPNVKELILSDIGLNDSSLITLTEALKSASSLRSLDLSNNLEKPTKQRMESIRALITYVSQSPLEKLVVQGSAKCSLKGDICPLIFSLMNNKCLRHLDITGNQAGNTLALALSKALQVNKTLLTLRWDDNVVSLAGYIMLRSGLQKNKSLIYMATPSNDISLAIAGTKEKGQFSITDVLKDIDELIYSNMLKQRGEIETFDYEEEETVTTPLPTSLSSTSLMASVNVKSATPPVKSATSTQDLKASQAQPGTGEASSSSFAVPAKTPKAAPPRPPVKQSPKKPKPSGIDTSRASALFGQLNDFLANNDELTPEEVAQMKMKK